MGSGERKPESVAALVGFALGMADAMAISALLNSNRKDAPFDGVWFLALVAVATVATIMIGRLRRNPMVVITVATAIPPAVATALASRLGMATDAGRAVRGVALILSFTTALGVALWFARLKRELDRKVFAESSIVAFFATAAVGVVYGIAQEYMDAPAVSFAWLAIFGLAVFAVSLQIHERKYS